VWAEVLTNMVLKPEHAPTIYSGIALEASYDEERAEVSVGSATLGSYSRSDQAIPLILLTDRPGKGITCTANSDL
jgi:hypothetical protein